MKNLAGNGIDLVSAPITAEESGVGSRLRMIFRSEVVQIPTFSLTEWYWQEPNRFAGHLEDSGASYLRERGDNACFEFMRADCPPSAEWFRPSAREAAWFFAHGYGQTLDFREGEVLIETSSIVLKMSHLYIREDSVLLKVTRGKLAFMCVSPDDVFPHHAHSLWRRRLQET